MIGGFFYIITFESKVVNAGNTIYVDDENILGPWDGSLANPYQTVQDGVDNANIGEIVFVFNGTYYEHVEVNKTISLKGEDRINTIIDGGSLGDVVTINVDWVNITGFTVTQSGDSTGAGIKLFNAHNCKIINNNASLNNGNGIFLSNSNGNNILDNIIYENQITGITFSSSSNNSISNNYISNNRNGIVLDHSIDNYIINNPVISGNGNRGIYLDFSSNNTIENNTCNSNVYAGIRFDDSALNLIKNNICNLNFRGIELWGSDGNIITGNIASNNVQFGISLIDLTIGNSIAYNTANGNSWAGISLYYTSNNTIMNNTITSNLECGIYLWQSSTSNNILNNNINNNDIGVLLEEFSNNTNILRNNITNNNMGVNIINSFYNNIENNNISINNEYGIRVFNSGDNKIAGNIVSNNNNGIRVEYFIGGNDIESNNISNNLIGINITTSSNDNTITANDISNNLYGIVMDSTDSNIFTRNNIKSNTLYAIDISSGEFNLIYHNNFIDNNGGGIQANDSAGMNGWYINYPTGGNYWNDWTTPDTMSGPNQDQPGSDGFVDFPYYLDGGVNARDRYPFADPMDFAPPEITNLQPPDGSIINDSTPTISANYSDPSGIDTRSVVLTVNGIDVTSSATVTETSVSYLPVTALSDGVYTVYVEVQDIFGYLATESWSFTVDATPPDITNPQPPDSSTINDMIPTISADYSDPSGININSVKLMVDGVDVTSSAIVTVIDMSYIPGIALSEGVHTVYLEVRDNVGNLATITWSFILDLVLPPPSNLITKVVNSGNKVELEWEPPISPIMDHYLIYRADSQTEFDFTIPNNSSTSWLDPLNTTWIDPDPSITQIDDDFYYIVRAANSNESDISSTSNTAGIWTRIFEPGISTFSLPLEPFVKKDTEFYCQDMNSNYIKWMNLTTRTWMRHGQGDSENNTVLELGEGFKVEFNNQTRYTFCGMPGAMIVYDDDGGFSGFNPDSVARNLSLSVEPNGYVILTWQAPSSMTPGDWYEVYYSNTRDGFFRTLGVNYNLACPTIDFGTNTTTITGLGASDPGARLYFMVVPFNASGVRGSSTYSIGVWTEEYYSGYDTLGIPLKLESYRTTGWYCNNIPDTVGINYYIESQQRWGWHATSMPAGAFDVVLEMGVGYQISTSGPTKFTFIGR